MHEHEGLFCKTGSLRIIAKFADLKKKHYGPNLYRGSNSIEYRIVTKRPGREIACREGGLEEAHHGPRPSLPSAHPREPSSASPL